MSDDRFLQKYVKDLWYQIYCPNFIKSNGLKKLIILLGESKLYRLNSILSAQI